MDALLHTIIAVGSLAAFYYAGYFIAKKTTAASLSEDMVSFTLDMLERDGLIRTETGKDGEEEIVPIHEIVADALKKETNGV